MMALMMSFTSSECVPGGPSSWGTQALASSHSALRRLRWKKRNRPRKEVSASQPSGYFMVRRYHQPEPPSQATGEDKTTRPPATEDRPSSLPCLNHRERQANRRRDRQRDRQRETERETDRQTDRHRQRDRQRGTHTLGYPRESYMN